MKPKEELACSVKPRACKGCPDMSECELGQGIKKAYDEQQESMRTAAEALAGTRLGPLSLLFYDWKYPGPEGE